MERLLPTYQIGNTRFVVDIDYNLLRHPVDDRNTISFTEDLEDKGDHYNLYIDPCSGACASFKDVDALTEYILVQVPQMVHLDPEGIASKYGMSKDVLPSRDKQLYMDPDLFRKRENGQLPVIELCGHPFFVDLPADLLQPKDDFSTMGINISGLAADGSGTRYRFLYDPETHQRVSMDSDQLLELPKGLELLEIPFENVLDSYAVARERGLLDSLEWFRKYPVRTGLKARVVPRERTLLPELIRSNLEEQKRARRKGRRP